MPFNGSGSFTRNNGTNSGSTTWADDRDAGTKITAANHDAHDQDIADGLSNCITKDGQTTITADIPMSGYKFTNVDDATARTQFLSLGQFQDCGPIFATSTGSSSAYVLTLSPAVTAYTTGMRIVMKANHTSDGTCTVNVSGLGAKTLKDCDGNAYVAGCIQSGQLIEAYYDGTDFRTTTIRTTPWTDYTPSYSGSNGLTITGTPTTNLSRYRLSGPFITIIGYATVAVNAGGGTVVLSPPTGFSVGGSSNPVIGNAYAAAGSLSASNRKVAKLLRYSGSQIGVERPNEADYTGSTTYHVSWFATFEV